MDFFTFWFPILLTVIGVGSTVVIAVIFRFKWKSKIEIVFETNVCEFLQYVFGEINYFDRIFEKFFMIYETKYGDIPDEAKHVFNLPKKFTENNMSEFKILKQCADEITRKNGNIQEYLDNPNIVIYLPRSFLIPLSLYVLYSTECVEWFMKNYNDHSMLKKRLGCAREIVTYLDQNNFSNNSVPAVVKFVKKWRSDSRF